MKVTNYIINGVLAIAVLVLFILQFSGKKSHSETEPSVFKPDSVACHLPVAYIATDSLLSNYNCYNDLNEALMKNIENKKYSIGQRYEKLQKEIEEHYRKAQLNSYLTKERMQQEELRLQKQSEEIQKLETQFAQEVQIENQKMIQQVHDSIQSALNDFNTPQKYQLIFSNMGTDNLFYADKSYDITQKVIEFLNARYSPKQ
jgi:outer membrane protein